MKTKIARIIELATFRKVRFMYKAPFPGHVESLRWIWTPLTNRFKHSGWIFLSPAWLRRFL